MIEYIEQDTQFFSVRLDFFAGPLDLLLHLVKQRELPIEKVSLAQITNQYLACLEDARDIDLDIAGEYLVIAATLLSIKSSVLLNQPVELVEDEDGNLVDPHEELLRQLREAEIYKDGAEHLAQRHYLGLDVFAAPGALKQVSSLPPLLDNHDPLLLGRAFKRLLEQAGSGGQLYNIKLEPVSVLDVMLAMLERLQRVGREVVFTDLIPDLRNRALIIGSFIALLELSKRQLITLRQDENFDVILVGAATVGGAAADLAADFRDETSSATDSLTVNA